jgi:Cdc6-like AAA superfamily ATPase
MTTATYPTINYSAGVLVYGNSGSGRTTTVNNIKRGVEISNHRTVFYSFSDSDQDMEGFLNKIYELLNNRVGENKSTATNDEKLINQVTGEMLPVTVVIDDATTTIGRYDKSKQKRVISLLEEIICLSRSANISVILVSNDNNSYTTGLSSAVLRLLTHVPTT